MRCEVSKKWFGTMGSSELEVLLACWQALLRRLTGQPEIVSSMELPGRKHQDLGSAFGLFARALPIRCSFDATKRFGQVLDQVTKTVRESEEWQHYFAKLQEGQREWARIAFAFEDRSAKQTAEGLSFSILRKFTFLDTFDLRLVCIRVGESLSTELHYDPNVFDGKDIQRLASEFQTLLESCINHPEVVDR